MRGARGVLARRAARLADDAAAAEKLLAHTKESLGDGEQG